MMHNRMVPLIGADGAHRGIPRRVFRLGAGAALAAVMITGCGESQVEREIEGGGGVRFVLPAEADGVPARFEVWHRNAVDAPGCAPLPAAASRSGRLLYPAVEPEQLECSGMQVDIWDYTGRPVRHEDQVRFDVRAWGWDQKDDQGDPVASGFYPTHQPCVDNEDFWFDGVYFVLLAEERRLNHARGNCEWPLWIRGIPGENVGGAMEFSPMPILWNYDLRDTSVTRNLIKFRNPYTVRVRVEGYKVFEQDVELVDGFHTEVRVALVPEDPIQEK